MLSNVISHSRIVSTRSGIEGNRASEIPKAVQSAGVPAKIQHQMKCEENNKKVK